MIVRLPAASSRWTSASGNRATQPYAIVCLTESPLRKVEKTSGPIFGDNVLKKIAYILSLFINVFERFNTFSNRSETIKFGISLSRSD